MTAGNSHSIIIIGAGPAGLTLAYHLKQRGHRPLIIESGDTPGYSWKQMPDFLALVSFWKSNFLLKMDRFKYSPISQVSAPDFAQYLESLAKDNDLNILPNTLVTGVEKEDGLFLVETNKGSFTSEIVVNATGYYKSPYIPNYSGLENTQILNLHFKDYKNPRSVEGKENILVVGARLSAGQLLVDLKNSGAKLSISSRSPVESMSPTPILKFFLLIVDHIEKPMQSFANEKIPTSAPMPYEAKQMINRGEVKLLPGIKSIHQESVTFEDGHTEPFDAILFATGFKPQFPHLGTCIELDEEALPKFSDGLESLYCENLFFLGLDHQRNIQSRFLRGIRNDAKELAEKITKRLYV